MLQMGLFFETKKATRILLVTFLVAGFGLAFPAASAEPSEEAKAAADRLAAEKAVRQQKLLELNKQIRGYQEQISTTRQKSNTLKNEISIFDSQIASTELQIQARETQIEDTQLQIAELEKIIQQKTREIGENKKILSELLVELSEYDDQFLIKTTISSDSLSSFFDQVQYTQSLQDKVFQLLQKIKELKAKLEREQAELKVYLKNLEELKAQLEITRRALDDQRNQKQQLLNQTRGLERNYQKLLAASKEDEANLEKEIQDLDAQIRAKLGQRSVAASRGLLAWPMDGILTQKYGNTGFTALGYNFHNGIDVAAPAAQPIYAAGDGVVLYTDRSDAAYGNWVAVKHNLTNKGKQVKIITLYAHMRSFKVKPGQEVKQGDLIGYEGNTGNTTKKLYGPERGYHIHFGVYDVEGFGVNEGKYSNIYGAYRVPYGYTYNPLDFL